jgi:hypothetical protein
MVIDGRLRQGKALFSKVEFGSTRSRRGRLGASVHRSRLLPSTPAFQFLCNIRDLIKSASLLSIVEHSSL